MGVQGLPRNSGQTSATDQLVQMGTKVVDKERDSTTNLGSAAKFLVYNVLFCRY